MDEPGGQSRGLSTVGGYARIPLGRPPTCRLDAAPGARCRLTVRERAGTERVVFDVPVAEVERAELRVGQLRVVVAGRRHPIVLAAPGTAAHVGMRTMGHAALGQAAGGAGASAGMLAGSAVAGWGMARRERQVDAEGLLWLRLFADHGVPVEAPQRWKPRVRYGLLGVVVLLTVVGVLGSLAGVAEEGGWTAQARAAVLGMGVLVVLAWLGYAVVTWLLWRTVRRDTARRVGAIVTRE